jgi:serine protease AprX
MTSREWNQLFSQMKRKIRVSERKERSNMTTDTPEPDETAGSSTPSAEASAADKRRKRKATRRIKGKRTHGSLQPETPLCGLCPKVDPEHPVRPGEQSLGEYRTAQRELLQRYIESLLPDVAPSTYACRVCLETIERQIQARQFVSEHGEHFYADLQLGARPILPTPARMNASTRFTGRGITIAFIDSGFYPHPDLIRPANRILEMYDAVKGERVSDIKTLVATHPGIEEWHGTMTACVAAGNGYRSKGLYRGLASDANIVLIKVMTPQFGIKTPEVVRALRWIREHHERYGIRVVNMSLGVDETTASLEHPVIALVEELSSLGIVVVAASGNNPFDPVVPPGAAPSAITVGGYNDNNSTEWMRRELWYYSHGRAPNGTRKPELLAPSIWVAAPVLPNTQVQLEADALFRMAAADDTELMEMIPALASQTVMRDYLLAATSPVYARSLVLRRIADEKLITPNYKHVDGTSFAAPIISSIVAQMLEARPELTPAMVKEILCSTAVPLAKIPREVQGHGIVQTERALEAASRLSISDNEGIPVIEALHDKIDPWERLPS